MGPKTTTTKPCSFSFKKKRFISFQTKKKKDLHDNYNNYFMSLLQESPQELLTQGCATVQFTRGFI